MTQLIFLLNFPSNVGEIIIFCLSGNNEKQESIHPLFIYCINFQVLFYLIWFENFRLLHLNLITFFCVLILFISTLIVHIYISKYSFLLSIFHFELKDTQFKFIQSKIFKNFTFHCKSLESRTKIMK